MTIDVGDVYRATHDCVDAAGALANAATVTLTVTLPDQTTTSPAVTNPPAQTGKYLVDVAMSQEGLYKFDWVTTAPATRGVYWEEARLLRSMLSLTTGKNHLNIPLSTTTDDEELRFYLEVVTEIVESFVGACVTASVTEEISAGTDILVLSRLPVLSVASVASVWTGGASYATADLKVDKEAGLLRRALRGAHFSDGPWTATYTVGRVRMPAKFVQAAKEMLRHLWDTQRGGEEPGPVTGDDDEPYVHRATGYSIPRRVIELLEKDQVPRRSG